METYVRKQTGQIVKTPIDLTPDVVVTIVRDRYFSPGVSCLSEGFYPRNFFNTKKISQQAE